MCQPHELKCNNSNCVPRSTICNGFDDCGDGSDEVTEIGELCSPIPCSNQSHFSCDNETNCVPMTWLCDGQRDCQDGSDENPKNCNRQCPENTFKCEISSRCIPVEWKCDNTSDCGMGDISDESNCGNKTCEIMEFTCENYRCISIDLQCNGVDNCGDGSDEKNCQLQEGKTCNDGNCYYTTIPLSLCSDLQFTCKDSYCIPKVSNLHTYRNFLSLLFSNLLRL